MKSSRYTTGSLRRQWHAIPMVCCYAPSICSYWIFLQPAVDRLASRPGSPELGLPCDASIPCIVDVASVAWDLVIKAVGPGHSKGFNYLSNVKSHPPKPKRQPKPDDQRSAGCSEPGERRDRLADWGLYRHSSR